jgi:hypothetical protein
LLARQHGIRVSRPLSERARRQGGCRQRRRGARPRRRDPLRGHPAEIAPGAIQQLVSNFADPKVGCVAGELILRKEGHDAPPRQSAESIGAMKMDQKCESICDSPVGVYGGFYAIRRELAVPQPAGHDSG